MNEIAMLPGTNLLLGTWKLRSFAQMLETGERCPVIGEHPDGYISYSADGRMYAIAASDGRVKPRDETPADEEAILLYRTMFSYAGTYTVEGDKLIHHVDISWNEAFTGTEQVRSYYLDSDILTITTAPNKVTIDGREGPLVAVWEKLPGGPRHG